MDHAKSYFRCWPGSDESQEEINRLKTKLEDTEAKLDECRKENRRLRNENASLTKPPVSFPPTPQDSNESNPAVDPHAARAISTFGYSDSTVKIYDSGKQTSALEKQEEKVREKLQRKNDQYVMVSDDTDEEDDAVLDESEDDEQDDTKDAIINKTKVTELMQQINRLQHIIKATEKDKYEMTQTLKEKDKEIASLQKQVQELKEINNKKVPMTLLKENKKASFSKSINEDLSKMDSYSDNEKIYSDDEKQENRGKPTINLNATTISSSGKRGSGAGGSSPGGSRKLHYDNTKEQIEILNNANFKNKSLSLCREQEKINKSGKDVGLITFFEKYIKKKNKTVDQIFNKAGLAQKDADAISNASGLVNVLSFATILYKVKVFKVQNENQRPPIDNAAIKDSVKYLAIWIVRTYGDKTNNIYKDNQTGREYNIYNFRLTKEDFTDNMVEYLRNFNQTDGKHVDSQI